MYARNLSRRRICSAVAAKILRVCVCVCIVATRGDGAADTGIRSAGHGHGRKRAFFTVFQPMLESPDWPSAYSEYQGGVVIMNPYVKASFA